MSIRLIALDLDDTLLDSQKKLPKRNQKALQACIDRGILVVPCTGRVVTGIPEEVRAIPGIRYAITVNGGVLVDLQEDKILDQKLLSPEIATAVCELAAGYHAMCDAYIDGGGISNRHCYENMDEYLIPPVVQELIRKTRVPVDDVTEYIRDHNCMVEKINIFFTDQQEREEIRNKLEKRGDVVISSSFTYNLEINGLGASKGEGILRLAEILGIEPEETMAFGDGENDISIINRAGISVAMENGNEKLKTMADYIAPSNNEAGVGQMIERLVLSRPQ